MLKSLGVLGQQIGLRGGQEKKTHTFSLHGKWRRSILGFNQIQIAYDIFAYLTFLGTNIPSLLPKFIETWFNQHCNHGPDFYDNETTQYA